MAYGKIYKNIMPMLANFSDFMLGSGDEET